MSSASLAPASGLRTARLAWGVALLMGLVVVALLATVLADRPTAPVLMSSPALPPTSASAPQPASEEQAPPDIADEPRVVATVAEPATSSESALGNSAPAEPDQEVDGAVTPRAAALPPAPSRPEPVEARIERVEPVPAPADTPLVLARAALAAGDANGAMMQLATADAGNPEVWALRASAEQQLGRPAAAVSAWTQALAGRGDVAAWWTGLGIALEASGQVVEARAAFEQAQAHDAGDAALASYVAQRLEALRPESTE